jgi:hypothetical protein
MEDPETNPCNYNHLIWHLLKVSKTYIGKKTVFSILTCQTLKLDPSPSCIKFYSKWN